MFENISWDRPYPMVRAYGSENIWLIKHILEYFLNCEKKYLFVVFIFDNFNISMST